MSDEVSAKRLSFRQQFPAAHLFDAAGIALAPASIVIATIAYAFLNFFRWIVNSVVPNHAVVPITNPFSEIWSTPFLSLPTTAGPGLDAILIPWASVVRPILALATSSLDWNDRFLFLMHLFGAITIWSFVGTILCRRSAMLFRGNEESTIPHAIQYGIRRWQASIAAPLIPMFSAALIGLLGAGMGLPGRLPLIGSTWLVVASPVFVLMGLAMACLILATVLVWPQMVAAVAIDGCDSFGGLSRAYSGLTSRPWHFLGYSLSALLIGVVLISMTITVVSMSLQCAMSSVAMGAGNGTAESSLEGPLAFFAQMLIGGVGVSFFWSAVTIISLLLREDVDGIPVDRVAIDDHQRPARDPLPVVGIPATDARDEVAASS